MEPLPRQLVTIYIQAIAESNNVSLSHREVQTTEERVQLRTAWQAVSCSGLQFTSVRKDGGCRRFPAQVSTKPSPLSWDQPITIYWGAQGSDIVYKMDEVLLAHTPILNHIHNLVKSFSQHDR